MIQHGGCVWLPKRQTMYKLLKHKRHKWEGKLIRFLHYNVYIQETTQILHKQKEDEDTDLIEILNFLYDDPMLDNKV